MILRENAKNKNLRGNFGELFEEFDLYIDILLIVFMFRVKIQNF